MLGLVLVCLAGCNSTLVVIVLILGETLHGAVYCGYMCSHVDITPRFAGTLMGITNTFGTMPGFISPSVMGVLTHNNVSKQEP